MQTEPEQWAVELFRNAVYEYGGQSIPGETECYAARLIQRAFEERERKLREEYEAERISLLQANYALNNQLADYALKIRQALRETPDAQ